MREDEFTELATKAEQGDVDAQYNLGAMYGNGIGTPLNFVYGLMWVNIATSNGHKDTSVGRELLSNAMTAKGVAQAEKLALVYFNPEQADADAQFNFGHMYKKGAGVLQSDKTAVKWYNLAAEKGNANAQFFLGGMHSLGHGVPQNVIYAWMWTNIAAANGYKNTDIAKTRELLSKLITEEQITNAEALAHAYLTANKGGAEAQHNLGVMYADGMGVPQDSMAAAKWFTLAAEQGHASAQFNLGGMYGLGKGIPKDEVFAFMWLGLAASNRSKNAIKVIKVMSKAINAEQIAQAEELVLAHLKPEQDDAETQFSLGVMYEKEWGVKQSYEAAIKWYNLAAEQGHTKAQFNLGVVHEHGNGVPQDYEVAVEWYTLSAEQGDADAQNNLGVMCYEGRGVTRDIKMAVKWFTLAAEQGNANAQYNLSGMYHSGDGVTQDYKVAIKWLTPAAEQGHAGAQFNLGIIHYNGDGVPVDDEAAVKWFTLAAKQGNAEAQEKLDTIDEWSKRRPL